jgi:hypothetical protein
LIDSNEILGHRIDGERLRICEHVLLLCSG